MILEELQKVNTTYSALLLTLFLLRLEIPNKLILTIAYIVLHGIYFDILEINNNALTHYLNANVHS